MQHEFYMWLVVLKPMQRAKCMFINIILYYCEKQRVSLINKIYTDRMIFIETMSQENNEESAEQTRS